MFKKVIFICFFFTNFHFLNAQNWFYKFEDAQKIALTSENFIVIDFWATWCGPCKTMDKESWSDMEVRNSLSNFTALKIDIDADKDIASRYNINAIPTVIIIDANGKEIFRNVGFMDKYSLKNELKNFSNSTKMINNELQNYFKQKSNENLLPLILKYFDFSLTVSEKLNPKIINTAGDYVLDYKKNINKKDKNAVAEFQKVELLKLFTDVYYKKFEKVAKKLSKDFVETEIEQSNLEIYNFLKLVSIKSTKSETKTTEEIALEKSITTEFINKINVLFSEKQ